MVTNEIATPTSTHNTGTSHKLVRRECASRKRFIAEDIAPKATDSNHRPLRVPRLRNR